MNGRLRTDIGARLIERGYAAIPIIPGTKRPGVLSNGQWVGLPRWQTRYNGSAPSETELRAGPKATPALACSAAFGGMVAIRYRHR